MDDALLVRVLNGVTDLHEKVESLRSGKIVLVAILGDAHAAHQFHDEVRAARRGGTTIMHLGDVRMVHHRQRLALGFEARDDLPRVHAKLDDLERDAAANGFLLLRHVNDAASSLTDFLKEFVASDALAGLLELRLIRRRAENGLADSDGLLFNDLGFAGEQTESRQAGGAIPGGRVRGQNTATLRTDRRAGWFGVCGSRHVMVVFTRSSPSLTRKVSERRKQ